MKKRIIGKCVGLSSEGKGIVKDNGDVIFVDALLLNEEAEIEISHLKNHLGYGEIKKIFTFSPERIKPLCPISTACGGCQFQNATYSYELAYKKQKVEEDLKRIGGINHKVNDVIGMENPYHYRNKIQIPFCLFKGRVIYGFYRNNSHTIIPLKSCFIEDIRAENILKSIAELMNEFHIPPYNENSGLGTIRHILIRTSYHFEQIMVVIVSNKITFPGRNNFIKELIKRNPSITTIIQNTNERHTNVILGEHEKILYGRGYIIDTILGVNFHISPKSFFQVNPIQTEKLYQTAIDFAKLNKDDELLDAYAGVCTIGLIASKYVKHVTSVELSHSAVINGISNAKNNNITNIDIIEADCTKYLLMTNKKFDVVILDPPRRGSTDEFLNALLKNAPNRIIYISCDPATLSRDLKKLISKYEILSIQPVDMFPRTFHCETIALLCLKR